jgi:hypothetical protein
MSRDQFMVQHEFVVSEAAAAPDEVLGAWLRLNAYMAPRLLGGRLPGARLWTDDTAMRRVQVSRERMDGLVEAGIALWDGDDLIVCGFDQAGQTLWIAKSSGGKAGNAKAAKARSDRRTPLGTPGQDSPGDSRAGLPPGYHQPYAGGEAAGDPAPLPPGLPRRDSDCESDSEKKQRRPARARAIPAGSSPAVAVAVSLGASLEGDDGIDLTPRWEAALSGLPEATIRAVFAAGPRLLRAGIRYPSGFSQVLEALAAEESIRITNERRDQAALSYHAEKLRCARMAERVTAWLATEEGSKVRTKLTATDRDGIAGLEDGNATGFLQVTKKHPDLARVAVDERGAA